MSRRRKRIGKFKSLFESRIAEYLRNKRVKFDYEKSRLAFRQPAKDRTYSPDFEIEETAVVIEAKGFLDSDARAKLIWVKEQHPEVNLVLLFQNPDKQIRRGSPTTYAKWAEKQGFEWADFRKGIPEKWITKKT